MLFKIFQLVIISLLLFFMCNNKFYKLGIISWRISIIYVLSDCLTMPFFHIPYFYDNRHFTFLLLIFCLLFPFTTEKTYCNSCNTKTYIHFIYSNHCPKCKKNIFK